MKRNPQTFVQRALSTIAWLLLLVSFGASLYGRHGQLLLLVIALFSMGTIHLVVRFVSPAFWITPFAVRPEYRTEVMAVFTTLLYVIELEIACFPLYTQIMNYLQRGSHAPTTLLIWLFILTVTIVGFGRKARQMNQKNPIK